MAETQVLQNAFNAGELSPSLLGRGDVPAYRAGAKRIQNWIVRRAGGLQRRPGSRYVNSLADETSRAWLQPFVFSKTSSFMLEFTPGKMRVYQDLAILNLIEHLFTGGNAVQVVTDQIEIQNHGYPEDLVIRFTEEAGTTLPAALSAGLDYTVKPPPSFEEIVQASAVDTTGNLITIGANDLVDGMGPFRFTSSATLPGGITFGTDYYVRFPTATTIQISLTPTGSIVPLTATGSGFLSMTPTAEYVRNYFRVYHIGTLVTFNDTGLGAYSVAPKVETPISIDTPYDAAALQQLQFAQDKDLMVIAANGTTPLQVLRRYADHAWEMTDAELIDGPYLNYQTPTGITPDTTITATLSAGSGQNVSFQTSKPIFRSGDIGRHVRFGDPSFNEENAWGWGKIVGIPEPAFTDLDFQAADSTGGTIDAALETLAFAAAHPFSNGEGPVQIDVTALGLTAGVDYWIHVIDSLTVSFHLSASDAINDVSRVNLTAGVPTFIVTSSTIQISGHSFSDNDGPVRLLNDQVPEALPTNFSSSVDYYLRVLDGDRFGLALTPGGDAVAPPSADGTGTHTITGADVLVDTALVNIERATNELTPGSEWRLGAFGNRSEVGHPQAVTFHEQRLVLAGAPGTPQTLHASQTGEIFDFGPDEDDPSSGDAWDRTPTPASGYSFALRSRDLNAVTWMESMRVLLCGTLGGVFAVSATTFGEAITPENVNARRGTRVGAAAKAPGILGTFLAFLEDNASVLSQAEFRPDTESIETRDLMDLSNHLSEGFTFDQIAVTQNPHPAFWLVRNDGTLLSLTFDPQQNVGAWAQQVFGGTDVAIESVAALNSALGGQVWISVARTINGQTHRYIEVLGDRFHEGKAAEDAELTDSSILYNGAATTTITGLDHLEGETVEILADGATHRPLVVSGGQIELDEAASVVRVGLGYQSILQHLPPEIDARRSTPALSLATSRIVQAMIRVNRTLGLKAGVDLAKLHEFPFRDVNDPLDEPPPLFSGVLSMPPLAPSDRDQTFYVVADGPQPAEVLSTYLRVEFSTR